jgi:hypothetical protein
MICEICKREIETRERATRCEFCGTPLPNESEGKSCLECIEIFDEYEMGTFAELLKQEQY